MRYAVPRLLSRQECVDRRTHRRPVRVLVFGDLSKFFFDSKVNGCVLNCHALHEVLVLTTTAQRQRALRQLLEFDLSL